MILPDPAFWTDFLYIRPYHPYWLVYGIDRNPQFNSDDGLLLDFKEGEAHGIWLATESFREVLSRMSQPIRSVVTHVPGHRKRSSNVERPLGQVVREIAQDHPDRFQGRPDTLLRTKTIARLASGGEREIKVHLSSITVANQSLVRDRTHILLDDIATTGKSIAACRKLLLEAGAKRVGALVLGRTTR
jgi:predicted amidophosphoribosyltransferase